MTHTAKILAFTQTQKFITHSSAALLLYGKKDVAAVQRAKSLIVSLAHQKKLRKALSKYRTPHIYIEYRLDGLKRRSPRPHDLIANECAALHAHNTQIGNREMVFPVLDGHSDFYDPKDNIHFEFDYGTMVYEGKRQIKDKLAKYPANAKICWIVTADHSNPTPLQEKTAMDRIFGYTADFLAVHPGQSHYFIDLSRFMAGERKAWSHPDGKGKKVHV